MNDKQIAMFWEWADSLDDGSDAARKTQAMQTAIADSFELDETSVLVLMCVAFCAGIEAVKDQF